MAFRNGRVKFMVATDVAARGLDVKDIDCVINFDFPSNMEDYVHRIGRTGRAGAKGTAYSFLSADHYHYAPQLVKIMQLTNQEIDEDLKALAKPVRHNRLSPSPRRSSSTSGYSGSRTSAKGTSEKGKRRSYESKEAAPSSYSRSSRIPAGGGQFRFSVSEDDSHETGHSRIRQNS